MKEKMPWHVLTGRKMDKLVDPLDRLDRDFDKIEIGIPNTGCPRCDLADELIELLRARLRTCDLWFTEYWFELDKLHSKLDDLRSVFRKRTGKEHDSRRTA